MFLDAFKLYNLGSCGVWCNNSHLPASTRDAYIQQWILKATKYEIIQWTFYLSKMFLWFLWMILSVATKQYKNSRAVKRYFINLKLNFKTQNQTNNFTIPLISLKSLYFDFRCKRKQIFQCESFTKFIKFAKLKFTNALQIESPHNIKHLKPRIVLVT